MAEIIMCRHGYTPANADKSNGSVSIRDMIYYDELCPLDIEYGTKQVDELGEFLSNRYSNKKILVCYSPYYRTRETKHHVVDFLNKNNDVHTQCVPAIREINQGLNYAKFRSSFAEDDYESQFFYDNIKGKNRIGTSYMQGESEAEVRQRVRHFSRKLKDYSSSSKYDGEDYDAIIVISHSTTIKAIYYDMYRKSTGLKTTTASAIKVDENPELLFKPKTQVPDDYVVDFSKYSDYFKLREFYGHLRDLRSNKQFYSYFGEHKLMPIIEETSKLGGIDQEITVLPGNTAKKGLYLIDCNSKQEKTLQDSKSTRTFWVLDGEGEFIVGDNIINVGKGGLIKISPNTPFSYVGQMKLIEKVQPDCCEENIKDENGM